MAPELPARTEQTLRCALEGKQRALYEGLRSHYREQLLGRVDRDGMSKCRMHVLEALLRLRQAACHPALLEPKSKPAGVVVLIQEIFGVNQSMRDTAAWVEVPEYSILHATVKKDRPAITIRDLQ